MRKIRFQNIVATSGLTLPAAAIFATLMGVIGGNFTPPFIAGYLSGVVLAYLLIELNNKNALIRIRSRLTTSIFLVYLGACTFLHPLQTGTMVTCSMLLVYHLLFSSYQERKPTGRSFYAFVCLGAGSLLFPQLLYFVPIFLWAMLVKLRTLGIRTFLAAMLGLILPYWLLLGASVVMRQPSGIVANLMQLGQFTPIDWHNFLQLSVYQTASFVALAWISIVAVIHYLRTSYNDKIRVRMLFHILIMQELALTTFLLLQPQHFNVLFFMLMLNSSPLIAHFFALTNKWLTNATFILFLLVMIALTVFNVWMPL